MATEIVGVKTKTYPGGAVDVLLEVCPNAKDGICECEGEPKHDTETYGMGAQEGKPWAATQIKSFAAKAVTESRDSHAADPVVEPFDGLETLGIKVQPEKPDPTAAHKTALEEEAAPGD